MTESSQAGNSGQFLLAARTKLKMLQKQPRSFTTCRNLYENAQGSLQWCYAAREWQLVLDLAEQLRSFLHLDGRWQDASKCAAYAMEGARKLHQASVLTHWMYYAGLIQDELGEYQEAERYYHESLRLAEAQGDWSTQGEASRRLGWLAHVRGERDKAEGYYRRALELHSQVNDPQGQARDWRQLGILAMQAGEFEQAQQYLQFSLNKVEGETDPEARQLQAGVWLDLGRIALRRDQLDEAQQQLERALVPAQAAQDRLLLGVIYFHQAVLAEKRGDLQKAQRQYAAHLDLARRAGDSRGQASSFIALGQL
jgi:tetratricopeptide (TPR) repeat protein